MRLITLFGSLLFIIVGFISSVRAQSTFKFTQASIQPFSSSGYRTVLTADMLEKLTNGEHGLSESIISSLNQSPNYYGLFGPFNIGLNANVGLSMLNKETDTYRNNMILRLGIQAHISHISGDFGYQEQRYRLDTLSSAIDGGELYIDSLFVHTTNIVQEANMLNLDVAVIFQTDREKQWSIYGGGGLLLGVSVNASTIINEQLYSRYEYSGKYAQNEVNSFSILDWKNNYSRFDNKMNLNGILYLPLGVDMRLGNHKDFWKRLHLFYEFRPELGFHYAPETGSISEFRFSQGLGLTVRF